MIHNNKEQVQQEALAAWKKKGRKGTLILPTGSGKTRVGVLAIVEYLQECGGRALVVVPTTNLRDNEWENEFKKWGYEEYLQYVTIECIQTLYKTTYNYIGYNMMVVDEIHTSLSPQYSKIYKIAPMYIMGLTATPPEDSEYRKLLDGFCPIVKRWTVKDAVEKGLIAPYILYNLPVRFTRSERSMYSKFNQMFNNAQQQLITYIRAFPQEYEGMTPFDLAQEASQNKNHNYHKVGKTFWQGMSMRKWVCYKAERKLEVCINIIKTFPDKKWIVFSKTTDFVDKLYKLLQKEEIPAVRYHSKMTTAERVLALEKAKSPEIRVIVSAEALNAGYDLPAIDGGICASAPSTMLNFIQQLGRTVRFEEDKLAVFINLYVPFSQEEIWVKKKTDGMKPRWISNIKQIE